jgi:hypothetical protein
MLAQRRYPSVVTRLVADRRGRRIGHRPVRRLDLDAAQMRVADQMITLQAAIMAYANDFMLLTLVCLISIPFVFAIGSTASLRGGKVAVEVVE